MLTDASKNWASRIEKEQALWNEPLALTAATLEQEAGRLECSHGRCTPYYQGFAIDDPLVLDFCPLALGVTGVPPFNTPVKVVGSH
jgi:hypothetical protein